jgi:hypothetical protein
VTAEPTTRRCAEVPADVLDGAVCELAPRCRYGCPSGACALALADAHDGMTLEQVAKHFHVTRERIRQIEGHALARPGLRRLFLALGAP